MTSKTPASDYIQSEQSGGRVSREDSEEEEEEAGLCGHCSSVCRCVCVCACQVAVGWGGGDSRKECDWFRCVDGAEN